MKNAANGYIIERKYLSLRGRGFMSKADVNPPVPLVVDGAAEQSEDTLTLAQAMIRKLDEESNKKLEHISAEEKGVA